MNFENAQRRRVHSGDHVAVSPCERWLPRVLGNRWSSRSGHGDRTPVAMESLAVPADHRLWLNDDESVFHRGQNRERATQKTRSSRERCGLGVDEYDRNPTLENVSRTTRTTSENAHLLHSRQPPGASRSDSARRARPVCRPTGLESTPSARDFPGSADASGLVLRIDCRVCHVRISGDDAPPGADWIGRWSGRRRCSR